MQITRNNVKLWTIYNNKPTKSKTSTPLYSLKSVIDRSTVAEQIRFNHFALFNPTLEKGCKAIQAGYLKTFPPFTLKKPEITLRT